MSDDGMRWGSAEHHETYIEKAKPTSRARCRCGCNQRATHVGKANGIALKIGCELSVRRWIRNTNRDRGEVE